MAHAKRNTDANALRLGRCSQGGASYFVTLCVADRKPVLIPGVARDLIAEAQRLAVEGIWTLRCITVMPDHVHLFFVLGANLTLAQCIARLKVGTKLPMQTTSGSWQANFYDHRLRAEDSVEATIRYIWMNAYRKNLVSSAKTWPWFYCCPEDWKWFEGLTESGCPFPEWLM